MYCTVDDIEQELGATTLAELSSEDGDAIDATVVEAYIAEESGVIDSYLRLRYVTPVSPAPIPIKKYTRRLVVLDLYRKRNRSLTQDESSEFDSIMEWLSQVRKGLVSIDAEVLESTSGRSAHSRANYRTPVISTEGY